MSLGTATHGDVSNVFEYTSSQAACSCSLPDVTDQYGTATDAEQSITEQTKAMRALTGMNCETCSSETRVSDDDIMEMSPHAFRKLLRAVGKRLERNRASEDQVALPHRRSESNSSSECHLMLAQDSVAGDDEVASQVSTRATTISLGFATSSPKQRRTSTKTQRREIQLATARADIVSKATGSQARSVGVQASIGATSPIPSSFAMAMTSDPTRSAASPTNLGQNGASQRQTVQKSRRRKNTPSEEQMEDRERGKQEFRTISRFP